MAHTIRALTWLLFPLLVCVVRPARADGPPSASLVPDEEAVAESGAPADSARPGAIAPRRALSDDPDYRLVPRSPGRHTTIRRVAVISGVGFAAVALWRGLVADDRAEKYDDAIFSESAARFRDSVRSAEKERNVAAALSAVSFSVALLTFVY
jgi:hypothetical protein